MRLYCILLLLTAIGATAMAQPSRPIVFPASDDELASRAAASPDQAPLGPAVTPARRDDLSWTFVGPRPITHEGWSGDTFATGRLSAIIVNPSDPSVVYLAAAQGGVWKSTDAGSHWRPVSDYISSLASGALDLDPVNPDILYYGTGEQHYSGDSFYGDGLFRSLDAGATWSKVAAKSAVGSYIARVLVNPADPANILVASDFGCLQSTDTGATWNSRISVGHGNDLAVNRQAPNRVFAAIRGSGIWRSTNAGTDWSRLTNGLPITSIGRINLASAPSDSNVLYASYVHASTGALLGMYKTSDRGDSWTLLTNTPNYLGGQGWYDNCVIVSPDDPNSCFAGGVFPYSSGYYGVIRTTDGGNSWIDVTRWPEGQLHPDQHCLAYGPDDRLWVGNDGGIWYTTDLGASWVNCNQDIGVTQFYNLAMHPTSPDFLLGGNQDNGTVRFEGGPAWPEVTAGDGGPCLVEWDSPNIYYTTYVQMQNLDKWDNGNYLGNVTGPWNGDRASWCNGPLVTDPNQPDAILAGTYRVFLSPDGGYNWSQVSDDLAGANAHLRALAVAQGNSNAIYSGASNGKIYVTTDRGANWVLRNTGVTPAPIPDIWLHPTDWRRAYICADLASGNRVYQTPDAGITWTSLTGDLPTGLRAMSLAVDFTHPVPFLYLGTDYGVYASFNNGANWNPFGDSLPALAVYDLAVDTANSLLVAATHGRGMWRHPLAPGSVAESPAPDLGPASWLRVSPNPCQGTLRIALCTAYTGNHPRILLCDASGRVVKAVTFSSLPASQVTVNLDGLPDGAYFCRLVPGIPSPLVKIVLNR